MSDPTQVHPLPAGWAQAMLGDLVQPTRPRHNPSDYPDLQFIGMEHVEAHTMRLLATVPASTMRSNAVHFWSGDLLYGRLRPYLNKVYRPEFEGLCSSEFIVFPSSARVEIRYLQYFLNSSSFVSFATHLNAGDRPRVDFEQIAGHAVPMPPLPEQHRIVAEIEKQFTRLDAAVAALERLRIHLRRCRASVLKAACEGRLVPTEAELARAEGRDYEPAGVLLERILKERCEKWEADQLAKMQAQGKTPKDEGWKAKYVEPERPGTSGSPEVPEGWAWARTSQVGDVQLGRQRSPKNRSKDYPTRYIRAANITWRGLKLDDVLEMDFKPQELEIYRLRPGDIVLSEASGSADQVGKPAIWRGEIPNCCFQNTVIRFRGRIVIPEFMHLVFTNFALNGVFATTARGVGIHHLGAEGLSTIDIPLPPRTEQVRIVEDVQRRLSVVEKLESTIAANLTRAQRLRQSILKRAFEGRLVPQDPNDEPAAVLLDRIRSDRSKLAKKVGAARASGTSGRRGAKRETGQLILDFSSPVDTRA